jgi:2-polyprenyl-6-methoxyphenol hydroxylase-like FAD-dependent oxidoreductase
MGTRKYTSKHIGIIGAGIAGLHLGLRLQRLGIDCTIITDRTPEQVAAAQLANIVGHWPTTLGRERVLGVYHWPAEEFGFNLFRHTIQTPEPIEIDCRAVQPARAVDYRIYLPRLMEDFVERGGRLEVRPVDAKDIGRIAERFDLIVVAMPGNGFRDLFARDDTNSPYDQPQRYFLAGLYEGFRPAHARSGIMSVKPGHGEAVAFPLLSRAGLVTALAVTTYKPDDLPMLRVLSTRPDRASYCAALLRTLEELHPAIYDRIDTSRFGVQGPSDLAQAAVTPIVRRPYVDLGGGKYAIALGDAHVTVDPMLAQGANIGSYSAFVLADAIAESSTFDLAFCHEVERSRSARILGASRWTNAFLQPPDEARMELMVAMSRDGQLADEYYDNFNRPEVQWQRVGSAERVRNWLAERELRAPYRVAAMEYAFAR